MKKLFYLISLPAFLTATLNANVIRVPSDQPKIQTAIDVSSNGDTILVSPGTYFENVNFNSKKVVLTSLYILNQDTSYISKTVIDGSKPLQPDSASCIRILKGQDSTTVVAGFTITGGQGTRWKDEHSSGTYREGGGIMVALSSPVIRNNFIINNSAISKTNVTSSGGGGIRCGDGSPKILNNVIVGNNGLYGGGIVLNWCGATIRNNIIMGNFGGQEYGGGGLWINKTNGQKNVIENNTIVGNHSITDGGAIRNYDIPTNMAILRNNIIYGNTAATNPQVLLGSSFIISHCDIDGLKVSGAINSYPEFEDTLLYLSASSPCIDAGDTSSNYNDPADTNNVNLALFPSKGGLRNDMGAFGGPGRSLLSYFEFSRFEFESNPVSLGNFNTVDTPVVKKIYFVNQSTDNKRFIDSIVVKKNKDSLKVFYSPLIETKAIFLPLAPLQTDSILITWTPSNKKPFVDTILIYHNAVNSVNPIKLVVKGTANKITGIQTLPTGKLLHNFPDPFSDFTDIMYAVTDQHASLYIYNIKGQLIRKYENLEENGSIRFDGSMLPSGVYLYSLVTSGKQEITNRMVIQR